MLDLMLSRLAQEEREREIARTHRIRAIREALAPSGRERFIPAAPARGPRAGRALERGPAAGGPA